MDIKTGKLLWQTEFENSRSNNVPDPIFHNGYLFASSGYGKGSILLKLNVANGRMTPETVWQTEHMDNHHGGVILHEGYFYGAGQNDRGWSCMDFRTGEQTWKEGGKGSITYAEQGSISATRINYSPTILLNHIHKKIKFTHYMKRRTFVKTLPAAAIVAGSTSGFSMKAAVSPGLRTILLPPPEKAGGTSVLEALQQRKTIRNISSKELPLQVLSSLLWAAFGVNREQASFNKPGRTAPSASNSQEIDLYVALPGGVYLYEAVPHHLAPVVAGDFRGRAGRGRAAEAPVNIFYVADLSRYDLGPDQPDRAIGDPEVQKSYFYTDTGFIAQNVYLFAASQGLAAWFHNCDKENPVREFNLNTGQRILFAQSVGYKA